MVSQGHSVRPSQLGGHTHNSYTTHHYTVRYTVTPRPDGGGVTPPRVDERFPAASRLRPWSIGQRGDSYGLTKERSGLCSHPVTLMGNGAKLRVGACPSR